MCSVRAGNGRDSPSPRRPVVSGGWDHLLVAWDINDRGQIVGGGMPNGQIGHGFVLMPVEKGDQNYAGLMVAPDIEPFILELTDWAVISSSIRPAPLMARGRQCLSRLQFGSDGFSPAVARPARRCYN